MKNITRTFGIIASTAMMLTAQQAAATVHTVSNVTNSIAMYDNVDDALDAASPNDTIYLMASPTSYGNFTVEKPLVILGSGTYPEIGQRSRTGTISINPQGSGTMIRGVDAGSIRATTAQEGLETLTDVTDLVIEYNRINDLGQSGSPKCINWVVRNNVFNTGGGGGATAISISQAVNLMFSNNVFRTGGTAFSFGGSVNSVGNVFRNNIVSSSGTVTNTGLSNCLVLNNIFYNVGSSGSFTDCTVSHNLFFGNVEESQIFGIGTSGTNNIYGSQQDPQFVDVSSGSHIAQHFVYPGAGSVHATIDFNLQPGSPAAGTGVNGEDMGIHSGPYAWVVNPAGGVRTYYPGPRIPDIHEVINPGVAVPNSTMTVNIKARNAN